MSLHLDHIKFNECHSTAVGCGLVGRNNLTEISLMVVANPEPRDVKCRKFLTGIIVLIVAAPKPH